MDENSEKGTVVQFCSNSYQNSDQAHVGEDDYGHYMHVKDPVVLASFVAFCSGNHHRVFLRGCCRNFPKSFPSLFRDQDGFCGDPKKRWSAYIGVLRKLRDRLTGTRWGRGESWGSPSTLWNQDPMARRSPEPPYRDLVRHAHARHRRPVMSHGQAEHGGTWMDLPVCRQPRRAADVDGGRPLGRPLVATCQTAGAARSVSCHAMRPEERARQLSPDCFDI